MTVVGRAFLVAVGLAHGAVNVQDQPGEFAVAMGLVDPLPRDVDQELQVLLGAEGIGLKAGHLTGRSRRLVLGAAADYDPQRGIDTEAFGIVDVFVAGQSAVEGLPQQGEDAVLGVAAGAGIAQATCRRRGQVEGLNEFAIGEESGITGDGGAVELQFELVVEVNAQGGRCGSHPLGSSVVAARYRRKHRDFQSFSANVMPKRPSHRGNMG